MNDYSEIVDELTCYYGMKLDGILFWNEYERSIGMFDPSNKIFGNRSQYYRDGSARAIREYRNKLRKAQQLKEHLLKERMGK